MKKFVKPSIIALLIVMLTSGYALFVTPLIGLADNGDFARVMMPNGLKHEQQRDDNDFFGYFNYKYDILQYYNEAEESIKSSHSLIIKMAMALDNMFSRDDKFDIRMLAVIYLIILLVTIYWIVEIVEEKVENIKAQYLLAILAAIIFGDVGYTAFFNSFYGEAVAYPFYLLSIVALLKFSLGKQSQTRYLIIYFIASIMLIGSKNQLALNGILSFGLLILIVLFKIDKKKKIVSVALGVVLLGSSFLMFMTIDDNIQLINKYNMMTRGVMLFEPNVQEVAKEIGLNEQYSLLAETIYFDRTPLIHPKDPKLLEEFYPKYNVMSIVSYYVKNPKKFSKVMEFGWKNSFTIRPPALGNFSRDSGRDYGEKTGFFTAWSSFKSKQLPHSADFVHFILLIFLALAINRIIIYKAKNTPQIVYYSELVMLYVFLTGLSQLLISFIGAGDTDLQKHLFVTTVSLDLLFYYNLAYLISLISKSKKAEIKFKGVV